MSLLLLFIERVVVACSPFHARKRDTGRRSVVLTSGTILRIYIYIYITHPLYLHTHYCAKSREGGRKTTDRKGVKGELRQYQACTGDVTVCTWILIGLRDYWSKWADRRFLHRWVGGVTVAVAMARGEGGGGREQEAGSSLTGCSIRFAATDKLTIDRYAHRPSIWHYRDSGCSLPLTWNRNQKRGGLDDELCERKADFFLSKKFLNIITQDLYFFVRKQLRTSLRCLVRREKMFNYNATNLLIITWNLYFLGME